MKCTYYYTYKYYGYALFRFSCYTISENVYIFIEIDEDVINTWR